MPFCLGAAENGKDMDSRDTDMSARADVISVHKRHKQEV